MNKREEKHPDQIIHSEQLIHKELSWLAFNERVLQEAQDKNVPLIERIRFLGIYSNNQDEFFKVRVADLKRQVLIDQSRTPVVSDPNRAAIILKRVQDRSLALTAEFTETYDKILKELKNNKIYFKDHSEISASQRDWIKDFFKNRVKPYISPIVLTNEMNLLSFLKDAYTYLAVEMFNGMDKQYALVEIPADKISRIIEIPSENRNTKNLMWLDNIIRVCLDDIFKGFFNYQSIDAYAIKINRDAEYIPSQELNHSVLENMSEGLKQRLTSIPTRLACDEKMPDAMLATFVTKLKMSGFDSVTRGHRYHNFKDLMDFPNVGSQDMEYPRLAPLHCQDFDRFATMFEAIRERDILLYYPYYTFSYMTEFLRQSSYDPSVIAIKINIYRVARNSMIIKSLIDAANNGKQVTVVVELKARFDESNNIEWAKLLTEAGVKVLFGMHSLKIHSKLCIVTRKENGKLTRYCHIGTGNFNEKSARIYTDFALFTKNEELTREVDDVFDFIEAPYIKPDFRNLMVSPINARSRIYELIDNEISNAYRGITAKITVKINNLVDDGVINKLYQASQAGVKIEMIVRGMCTLIPGIAGLSDNIKIISIVDRFLEHPRVMIFHNNGNEKIYISSADWMTRNLDHRIEVATPIFSEILKQRIKNIINIQLKDNVKARIIDETQKNTYVKHRKGSDKVRSQIAIYDYLSEIENEKQKLTDHKEKSGHKEKQEHQEKGEGQEKHKKKKKSETDDNE
jgi:polyphosphate kinase